MRLSRFFIDRPIFAAVLSLFVTIIGGIAYLGLPVTQFPEITPPTITVSATYPGASAQTVADTVAAVIEQEVNGVDGMLYMYSQSTADGSLSLTVTFEIGYDIDKAQVLVQNRVASAEPRLPEEVRRNGVTVRKNSPDLLLVVHMVSPDSTYDQVYISNYALLNVRDVLARIEGVGGVNAFGAREYSMRDLARSRAHCVVEIERRGGDRRTSPAERASRGRRHRRAADALDGRLPAIAAIEGSVEGGRRVRRDHHQELG